jgi:hypothetical protein
MHIGFTGLNTLFLCEPAGRQGRFVRNRPWFRRVFSGLAGNFRYPVNRLKTKGRYILLGAADSGYLLYNKHLSRFDTGISLHLLKIYSKLRKISLTP